MCATAQEQWHTSPQIQAGRSSSGPWQNCGTGVSPVVFTVKNGVFKPLFSLSPRAASVPVTPSHRQVKPILTWGH